MGTLGRVSEHACDGARGRYLPLVVERLSESSSHADDCVVIDTNAWVHETRLLRSPLGAAFLYAVRQLGLRIGLPEVVELEIVSNVEAFGNEFLGKAVDAHRQMLVLLGRAEDYPTKAIDFKNAALRRIEELSPLIERVALTAEHALAAGRRVINGTPPNSPGKQQFKDSAIWEAALQLALSHEVHLITSDRAFFEGLDPSGGLAAVLNAEAVKIGRPITAYSSMKSFLESISSALPPLDKDRIASSIAAALSIPLQGTELYIEGMIRFDVTPFLTENADTLAVEFVLEFHGIWTGNRVPEPEPATVRARGECHVHLATMDVSDLRLERVDVVSVTDERSLGTTYYAQLDPIILGARMVTYRLRAPLPGQ